MADKQSRAGAAGSAPEDSRKAANRRDAGGSNPIPERVDLVPGTLDMLVLRALVPGALHGYGIARRIQQVSDDVLQVEEGSLYPALHRMARRGWIEPEWGVSESNRRAKFYRLTDRGHRQLDEQLAAWERISAAIDSVLRADWGDSLMSVLERFGVYLSAPDMRPAREIEFDIQEELAFHIEMRTRDNSAAGMSESAARRDAERRFGAVTEVYEECRHTQLEERIMLQRINFALMVVLLLAVGIFGWQTWSSSAEASAAVVGLREDVAALTAALANRDADERPARVPRHVYTSDGSVVAAHEIPESTAVGAGQAGSPAARVEIEDDPAPVLKELARRVVQEERARAEIRWLDRYRNAPEGFHGAWPLATELADLSPDTGLALMRAIFPRIESMDHRRQSLKPFAFHGGHPHTVRVLHLGMTDPDPGVREFAAIYVRDFALRDFAADPDGYQAWWQSNSERTLGETLRASASEWVARLRTLRGAELQAEIRSWHDLDLRPGGPLGVDLPRLLVQAGLLSLIADWDDELDDASRAVAISWLKQLPVEDEYARNVLASILTDARGGHPQSIAMAAGVIGKPGLPWRAEMLFTAADDQLRLREVDQRTVGAIVEALIATEDARRVAALIRLLREHENAVARSELDRGLESVTGVRARTPHDADWWRRWWESNRSRFGADAQAVSLDDAGMAR